jgi:hypothetical protein
MALCTAVKISGLRRVPLAAFSKNYTYIRWVRKGCYAGFGTLHSTHGRAHPNEKTLWREPAGPSCQQKWPLVKRAVIILRAPTKSKSPTGNRLEGRGFVRQEPGGCPSPDAPDTLAHPATPAAPSRAPGFTLAGLPWVFFSRSALESWRPTWPLLSGRRAPAAVASPIGRRGCPLGPPVKAILSDLAGG